MEILSTAAGRTHASDQNLAIILLNLVSKRMQLSLSDNKMDPFLTEAIREAKIGLAEGGIPIGSVIVHHNKVLGRGHNRRIQRGSVVLHGEMDALENAGRLPASIYKDCVLYTTLSPCPMCTGAILLYGIPKVVIGENETFLGGESLLKERGVEVIVANNMECKEMMKLFIKNHPELWNEDIGK